jgi:hypothetical protein
MRRELFSSNFQFDCARAGNGNGKFVRGSVGFSIAGNSADIHKYQRGYKRGESGACFALCEKGRAGADRVFGDFLQISRATM